MFGLFILWLATALGLWVTSLIVPGVRARADGDLLLAAIILGLLNALIRPLIWVLTLPLTVLTFGLFSLVINAIMIQVTAAIVPGFQIDNFGSALLASLCMTVFSIAGLVFFQWVMFDAIHWMHAGMS